MQLARNHGLLVCDRSVASGIGDKDSPDLRVLGYGKILAVECKLPGGQLLPEQEAWIDRLSGTTGEWGPRAYVVRPSDLERFKTVLEALSQHPSL